MSVIEVKGSTGRDEAFLNPATLVRPYLLSKHLLRPARDYTRERDHAPLFPPRGIELSHLERLRAYHLLP